MAWFGGEEVSNDHRSRRRLTGVALCVALQGCAPGSSPGPRAAAANPSRDPSQADRTSVLSPKNPGETRDAAPVGWDTLDPTSAEPKTLERAKKSCEKRSPKAKPGSQESLACVWLGAANLAKGEQRRALEYFRAACEAGEPLGCVGEGNVLMQGGVAVTGKGVLREPAAAEAAWKKACDLGARSGCWLLAQALERGKDAEGAQEYGKKACDLGVVEACPGQRD